MCVCKALHGGLLRAVGIPILSMATLLPVDPLRPSLGPTLSVISILKYFQPFFPLWLNFYILKTCGASFPESKRLGTLYVPTFLRGWAVFAVVIPSSTFTTQPSATALLILYPDQSTNDPPTAKSVAPSHTLSWSSLQHWMLWPILSGIQHPLPGFSTTISTLALTLLMSSNQISLLTGCFFSDIP